MNIDKFLWQRGVWFRRWQHSPTYAALALAHDAMASEFQVAKTVFLRVDGSYLLAVLPSLYKVNLGHLQEALDLDKVELASELECAAYFGDCDVGAIPPFGSLYGVQTVVAESLAQEREIVFEGNRHNEAFRMKFDDYYQLERPRVLGFAQLPEQA